MAWTRTPWTTPRRPAASGSGSRARWTRGTRCTRMPSSTTCASATCARSRPPSGPSPGTGRTPTAQTRPCGPAPRRSRIQRRSWSACAPPTSACAPGTTTSSVRGASRAGRRPPPPRRPSSGWHGTRPRRRPLRATRSTRRARSASCTTSGWSLARATPCSARQCTWPTAAPRTTLSSWTPSARAARWTLRSRAPRGSAWTSAMWISPAWRPCAGRRRRARGATGSVSTSVGRPQTWRCGPSWPRAPPGPCTRRASPHAATTAAVCPRLPPRAV
mmetsp:Transcript_804/g.2503  ORF Transcript_804/g.2503 Transcript_804/m.2503 type:complete len:274 (-) Transcript_804:190-1011(-)